MLRRTGVCMVLAAAFSSRNAHATSGVKGSVFISPQSKAALSSVAADGSRGDDGQRVDALELALEQRWRALFQEARSAFARGRFERARALYLEANTLKPSAKILANLAQVEISLRRYVDAAAHADAALRQLGRNPEVERDLAAAKRNVGTLVVTTNVDGALIEIDGEARGRAPLEGAIYVEPGEHEIRVTVDRAPQVERRIRLEPGAAQRLDVALIRDVESNGRLSNVVGTNALDVGHSSDSETTQASDGGLQRTSKPNPAALVGGGLLAVGGLGAGLWFESRSESRYDAATTKRRELETSSCGVTAADSVSRRCKSLLQDLRDGDCARNWATALFAFGGAALVGTALYWFWPRAETSRRGSRGMIRELSPEVNLEPKTPWLGVSGRF
ncbi:MAG: PEGA domain-containing protein [Polyangiaceae bacterium]